MRLTYRHDGEKGHDMKDITGNTNAGYLIIKSEATSDHSGIVLGRNGTEYVTWWYTAGAGEETIYYFGHYFSGRHSWAKAYADYHQRLEEEYRIQVEMYDAAEEVTER